jgi:hypothetical protein
MLPFRIDSYEDGANSVTSGFDDQITAIIFFTPTLLATILLLIPNSITAIIGSTVYLCAFALSVFMNYVLSDRFLYNREELGFGPSAIFLVLLTATVIAIIHSVKLIKKRKQKRKQSTDLLDDAIL